ncbi:DedA family protein [Dokdonella fugitiva]|uniref:DedA family protein n=1 Tax=Dokdonella fugitiva TaxID=328517 RepID=UPI002175A289|nr:DedA family protein [Dokdonella fugitiva]
MRSPGHEMAFLDQLISLFIQHGYFAVFAVLLISGLGVPIPEDLSLVAGGIIAGLGHADVRVMCAVGLAGVLVGDSFVFLVGRTFGVRALRVRWVAHVLTPRRHAQVKAKFSRYGNRLMFVARFLPGLRTAVFLTAGMSHRVSFLRFIALDGLAALVSVPFWIWLGYLGAEHREWVLAQLHRGQGALGALLVVLVAFVMAWAWRRGRERLRRLHAHRERRAERTRS